MTSDRRDKILRHVERSSQILEIGPSYAPIAPKSGGWDSRTLDRFDAEELRQRYADKGVDVSKIEAVDFVWRSGPMESAVPVELHGRFDACIASHVLEHVPNLVPFLGSLGKLLKSNGRVSLAVPDKRFCFDFFQPVTTTADVLEALAERRDRHPRKTTFLSEAYSVAADGQIVWSQHDLGEVTFLQRLQSAYQAWQGHDDSEEPYDDRHGMYFTPASFELLMLELRALGLTDFDIVDKMPTEGCEFFVTLKRGSGGAASDGELSRHRMDLQRQTLLDIREQADYLLPERSAQRDGGTPADENGRRTALGVNEQYVSDPPSPQLAVDVVPGWVSALPPSVPASAGTIPLFADDRVTWALQQLGGVWNQTVLELGPLEAGHTYMLHLAGAAQVTCVEANTLAYLRCLITKELLRLDRARFLLGDFVRWLEGDTIRYDVAFASGVLYHMVDPVRFLELLARKADRLFLWTTFVPDDGYVGDESWASVITDVDEQEHGGRTIRLHRRAYGTGARDPAFCGGVYGSSAWLRREDILYLLESTGFTDIAIGHEQLDHPNGPCFAIVAKR